MEHFIYSKDPKDYGFTYNTLLQNYVSDETKIDKIVKTSVINAAGKIETKIQYFDGDEEQTDEDIIYRADFIDYGEDDLIELSNYFERIAHIGKFSANSWCGSTEYFAVIDDAQTFKDFIGKQSDVYIHEIDGEIKIRCPDHDGTSYTIIRRIADEDLKQLEEETVDKAELFKRSVNTSFCRDVFGCDD